VGDNVWNVTLLVLLALQQILVIPVAGQIKSRIMVNAGPVNLKCFVLVVLVQTGVVVMNAKTENILMVDNVMVANLLVLPVHHFLLVTLAMILLRFKQMDIVIHVILVVMAVPGQHQVIVLLVQLDTMILHPHVLLAMFPVQLVMEQEMKIV
jgi:hypothetical protein